MASPISPTFSHAAAHDPKMIGYWKVGRTIGKGSSGRVKLARHSKTGQMAAVKIIPKAFLYSRMDSLNTADEEAERFELALQREIVIMKLIDHPNIMKLYDVWDTANHLYLILEHVQGGELFDYLCEQGRLSSEEALRYFHHIIAAVDYLHRFHVVHRDLKPENILLDAQHNVKLADFGMAAWQPDHILQTSCGSPHYAAPEVVSGNPYDGVSSDIWSCGIILHAMLVGRLPFDDDDCLELLEKVRIGEFDMPNDIDPLAQDLIGKMLTKDVSKRITMAGIRKHPFFVSQSSNSMYVPSKSLRDFARPLDCREQVDRELLRHLHTLWPHSSDDEIIDHLTSKERNWHKGIYQLLMEYRQKTMEDYDEDEEFAKVARLQRKKQRAHCVTEPAPSPEARITPSPSSIPPRDGPPTPRRAARSQMALSSISDDSLFFSDRDNRLRITLRSPSNSDTSLCQTHTPLLVPEQQDARMHTFLKEVVDHINVLYCRTDSAHSPSAVVSPNLALMHEIIGPQSMHAVSPNIYPLSAGNHTTVQPLTISKRQLHRRASKKKDTEKENVSIKKETIEDDYLVVEYDESQVTTKERAAKLKKRRTLKKPSLPAVSDRGSSLSSPLSSSPKKKWLGHMFRFKPSTLTLLSMHDVQTTRNECRRLLMAMDVRVVLHEATNLGVLKCRLDEVKDSVGVMKAVKFRVEVLAVEQSMLSLALVQEKGSSESFKAIYDRLCRDWVLDVAGCQTPQQVARIPGQRMDTPI